MDRVALAGMDKQQPKEAVAEVAGKEGFAVHKGTITLPRRTVNGVRMGGRVKTLNFKRFEYGAPAPHVNAGPGSQAGLVLEPRIHMRGWGERHASKGLSPGMDTHDAGCGRYTPRSAPPPRPDEPHDA
jgi:hypothetical protein